MSLAATKFYLGSVREPQSDSQGILVVYEKLQRLPEEA